jgi:hypothetical protein
MFLQIRTTIFGEAIKLEYTLKYVYDFHKIAFFERT